ncbi:phosphopantetheine-binding protein [uncultured Desulfobacter sp.]|uniref:phosphopantetheine-binding protein n=1 Tax=uncultured Desulfobacter sp. TaxID=240139 RepID=UPI002AA5F427|nr:phosphopantetheine-binding protein [uncultured Desulfobacter sp.]
MLEKELLTTIVELCNVQEDILDDFPMDSPLVGPDSLLGLDSLDAVEIVVMVQDVYDVRIDTQDQAREILATVKSLADYIRERGGAD